MGSFVDILSKQGVPYKSFGEHHHTTHGWISLDCPECSPGSANFRLGYNLKHNYFNCWSCGYLRLIPTIISLLKLNYHEAKTLAELIQPEAGDIKDVVTGKLKIPYGTGVLLNFQKQYLSKRGFDYKEIWKLWKVEGFALHHKLAYRLFIPIFLHGRVVSWTTRAINNDKPRYLSAPLEEEDIPHKSLLYGEDYCRQAIIICEGPTDVWRIGPGAVATFGVVFTEAQVLRASKYPVRVVAFDNEPEAQLQATRLCSQLEVFSGKTIRLVVDAKDPGETTDREVKLIRKTFLGE